MRRNRSVTIAERRAPLRPTSAVPADASRIAHLCENAHVTKRDSVRLRQLGDHGRYSHDVITPSDVGACRKKCNENATPRARALRYPVPGCEVREVRVVPSEHVRNRTVGIGFPLGGLRGRAPVHARRGWRSCRKSVSP